MGSSSSTEVADSIETDSKETKNSNFGLLNISNESLGGGINVIEIVTFILVLMAAIIFYRNPKFHFIYKHELFQIVVTIYENQ